jgi:hypothetical protein
MSYAPDRLLDLRHFFQIYVPLPDSALGIVGDVNHDGGYHCGWDRRRIRNGQLSDYSWQDSTRDSSHKTDAASAFDVGWFDVVIGNTRVTLIDFNDWFVRECAASAPDTLDVRSMIYTLDRQTVVRWDRTGKRSGGDSSHLKHTHVSYFRDAEDRDKIGPYKRFFDQYLLKGDELPMFVRIEGKPEVYISDGFHRRHLTSNAALQAALAAGYQEIVLANEEELDALAGLESSSVPGQGASRAEVRAEVRDAVADFGEKGSTGVRAEA